MTTAPRHAHADAEPSEASRPTAETDWVTCPVTHRRLPRRDTVELEGQRLSVEGLRLVESRRTTGQRLPGQPTAPSVPRRAAALAADALAAVVLYLLASAAVALVSLFISRGGQAELSLTTQDALALAQTLLFLTLLIAYLTLAHRLTGQTLGKLAAKLRVTQSDGASPITWPQALLRSLLTVGPWLLPPTLAFAARFALDFSWQQFVATALLLAATAYTLIDAAFALFDPGQRRTLHDRLTRSRVITLD